MPQVAAELPEDADPVNSSTNTQWFNASDPLVDDLLGDRLPRLEDAYQELVYISKNFLVRDPFSSQCAAHFQKSL